MASDLPDQTLPSEKDTIQQFFFSGSICDIKNDKKTGMSKGKPIKLNMGMIKASPGRGRFGGGRSRGRHKESLEDEVGAMGAETKETEVVEERD